MAAEHLPPDPFSNYLRGLREPEPEAHIFIGAATHLPLLLSSADWEKRPGHDKFGRPAPPAGTWQERVLNKSEMDLEIFIGNAVFRKIEDMDTESGQMQLRYLLGLASRPDVAMHVVAESELLMPWGNFAYTIDGPARKRYVKNLWTPDSRNTLINPSREPELSLSYVALVAVLQRHPRTIGTHFTPHLLDLMQASHAQGPQVYRQFLKNNGL